MKSLQKFLGALSIESATESTFELFASEGYDTVEKIGQLNVEQIAQVGSSEKKAIGLSRAFKIYNSWHSKRIQELLKHANSWISEESASVVDCSDLKLDLKGMNVCFTGKAPISRSELTDKLKSAGAVVQSSVNAKTDFLFLEDADSTSSKAKKARTLGVQIVSYTELL